MLGWTFCLGWRGVEGFRGGEGCSQTGGSAASWSRAKDGAMARGYRQEVRRMSGRHLRDAMAMV